MIGEVRQLRVQLDGLRKLTRELNRPIDKAYISTHGILTEEEGKEKSLVDIEFTESEFVKKSVDTLDLSKMWLGKLLNELGAINPYPESKNPENEVIEPTADSSSVELPKIEDNVLYEGSLYKQLSYIQKVKWLRAELEKIEKTLKSVKNQLTEDRLHIIQGLEGFGESLQYCIESGMWLGMELGRLRDMGLN